jgi:hypothetical protein
MKIFLPEINYFYRRKTVINCLGELTHDPHPRHCIAQAVQNNTRLLNSRNSEEFLEGQHCLG